MMFRKISTFADYYVEKIKLFISIIQNGDVKNYGSFGKSEHSTTMPKFEQHLDLEEQRVKHSKSKIWYRQKEDEAPVIKLSSYSPKPNIKEKKSFLKLSTGEKKSGDTQEMISNDLAACEVKPKDTQNQSSRDFSRRNKPQSFLAPWLLDAGGFPACQSLSNPMQRANTFNKWPATTKVWPHQLSNAGFYFTGKDTTVKCFSCDVETTVGLWPFPEKPEVVHFRLNNKCEFLLKSFPKFRNIEDIGNGALTEQPQTVAHNGQALTNPCNNDQPHSVMLAVKDNAAGNAIFNSNQQPLKAIASSGNHNQPSATATHKNDNSLDNQNGSLANVTASLSQHFEASAVSKHEESHKNDKLTLSTTELEKRTHANRHRNTTKKGNSINRPTSSEMDNEPLLLPDVVLPDGSLEVNMQRSRRHDIDINSVERNTYADHSNSNLLTTCNQGADSQNLSTIYTDYPASSFIPNREYEPDFSHPDLKHYDQRLKTYQNWNKTQIQAPAVLTECGLFFTGEDDVVRCFCCNLGLAEWAADDNPWTEHAKHAPHCWFLKKQRGQEFIDRIQESWKQKYNPKNAAFDDFASRLATFSDWREDISKKPKDLAEAGFFYTGEEDIVRCHYCDGGLRNWEPNDIPWEEHARWFSSCRFLIKTKGMRYIQTIKEKYETGSVARNDETQATPTFENNVMESEPVKTALWMGFSVNEARAAVTKYVQNQGHRDFTANDLVNTIIETQSSCRQNTQPAIPSRPVPEEKDITSLRVINSNLKAKRLCVLCKHNERCMLYVNCGHRVTCESCCRSVDFCPTCDKRVKKVLKTFLS